MDNHEIDFQISGDDMQYVEIELDPQETVIAEAGSFMMMDEGIKMDTVFGDDSGSDKGFVGKMLGAGRRLLTGEGLFMTTFTNEVSGKQRVSFAAPYPGKILPIDLDSYGEKVICQKDAFLAAAKGVHIGIEFQKKIGVGLFGGEGFIMQKLEGDGMAFLHAGGTLCHKHLRAGEKVLVDTGCLVAFTKDVKYNIEFVKGIKNKFFGGEGVFFASLEGPGTVWIQSLPFSRLAGRVAESMPYQGSGKDEGSVLPGFDLFGGK